MNEAAQEGVRLPVLWPLKRRANQQAAGPPSRGPHSQSVRRHRRITRWTAASFSHQILRRSSNGESGVGSHGGGGKGGVGIHFRWALTCPPNSFFDGIFYALRSIIAIVYCGVCRPSNAVASLDFRFCTSVKRTCSVRTPIASVPFLLDTTCLPSYKERNKEACSCWGFASKNSEKQACKL